MGKHTHSAVSGYVHERFLGPQPGNLNSSKVSVPPASQCLWPWAFGCSLLTGKESQGAGYILPYILGLLQVQREAAIQHFPRHQGSQQSVSVGLLIKVCKKMLLSIKEGREELRNLNQFLSCQYSSHLQRHCELTQVTISLCFHVIQVSILKMWSQASLQLTFFITASKYWHAPLTCFSKLYLFTKISLLSWKPQITNTLFITNEANTAATTTKSNKMLIKTQPGSGNTYSGQKSELDLDQHMGISISFLSGFSEAELT